MEFHEYLKSKKIDPRTFKVGEKERFEEFETLFNQIHPDSFTQQKLFLINKLRRKYLLEEDEPVKAASSPRKLKPRILPKPKLS